MPPSTIVPRTAIGVRMNEVARGCKAVMPIRSPRSTSSHSAAGTHAGPPASWPIAIAGPHSTTRHRVQPGGDQPLVGAGVRADDTDACEHVGGRAAARFETVEQRGRHAEHGVVSHEPQEHRHRAAPRRRSRRRTTASPPRAPCRTRTASAGPPATASSTTARGSPATPRSVSTLVATPMSRSISSCEISHGAARPCCVGVGADRPERPRRRRAHDLLTRGILCGGPSRSSASFGTSSTSGSVPVAASTAARTPSRTPSSRVDQSGA